ncbi:amino acid ABC transporter permease [Roseomonas gilardii]|uniref:ABC transporter permease n=1 Tax=Roseomonas gilardii TaxID=257708 RepID=A0A1L7AMK9_9PROT|nr:amino acid ABC transporter permease [Roseomonas gilardii]APT60015.1 ABC transporter permease [Roseomonas gilardii]MDT8333342.1 amino acid ABC transporter permease [Roseomonas gilardii]PZR08707.1 MAG: amino acid ABC transporter permease [Azospirillum brasilense]
MEYSFDFAVVIDQWRELFWGCLLTLQLTALAVPITLAIAILAVFVLQVRERVSTTIIQAFVEIVRNTPFLVQIFFLFFGLPTIGIRLDPNIAAVLALGLNGAAYAIEIIRSGVDALPKGQVEAGKALGMRPFQIFRHIILKPALRTIYPALTSQFIFLMLTSSIASSITARELTHVGAEIEATTFRSFEVYFVITGLYLLMSIFLSKIFAVIGRLSFSYPTSR